MPRLNFGGQRKRNSKVRLAWQLTFNNLAMKFFPILLFLAQPILPLSAQTVQWSDSIVVETTPQPVTAPRIALLKDGTPLVAWGTSGSPSRIWCARFENGAFSTPKSVVEDPAEPILFGFGGYDLAVSDSQVFVVFEQIQTGIFLTRSDDGGLTFTAPSLVQGPIPGGFATLASVEVDGTGNPIVSYIRDNNGASYEIRRSTDGGQTFGDPVTANAPAAGGVVCECCTSDLLASGDSVWLVFRNNNQNLRDIWVSRSTDLGASFDLATDVDATDWHLNACPIAGPRMARSGDSLVAVWMSRASGTNRVYLSTAHAGSMQAGQQFGFPDSSPLTAQNLPDITAAGDTIGVVFLEKAKEILFHFSTNGTGGLANQGKRFAVPNHSLQYPTLAFRNGVFHLAYADPTNDQVLYRQGRLTLSSPTSAASAVEGLRVFPNPADTGDPVFVEMALNSKSGLCFEWTDVLGNVVLVSESGNKTTGKGGVELETNPLHAGVYFLTARKNGVFYGVEKVILR